MKIIPYLSVPILMNSTILTFVLIMTCSCGLKEKMDRRIAFAVVGETDHGEQLLKFDQFRVTVKSSKDGYQIEIAAPGIDVVGCGSGTGPDPYTWAIDDVIGIPNGGNKTLVFSVDSTTKKIFSREWDKATESSRFQLLWSSKGIKKSNRVPVRTVPFRRGTSPREERAEARPEHPHGCRAAPALRAADGWLSPLRSGSHRTSSRPCLAVWRCRLGRLARG
jgi:hypothetical protein